MAAAKTSSSRKRGSSGSGSRKSGSSSRKPSGSRSSTSSSRGRASPERHTTSMATGTVATMAKKAKTPLIAGGAAVAGLASGAALKARSGGRQKVLGVSMPKPNGLLKSSGLKFDPDTLTRAAKQAGLWGRRVEHVATEVEHARKKVK
jgi:hypothetical protein